MTLVALLLLAGLQVLLLLPPTPLPASAPPEQFSAMRALTHVREIASRPHPSGTLAHEDVRRYLIEQITALGLQAEVQPAFAVRPSSQLAQHASAYVHNVLIRVPGTLSPSGSKALLLMAHYDSPIYTAGAAANGAAVGALLEALRALQQSPPLKQDVIVLFTDAREPGNFGAQAFWAEHPWADEVGAVLNLEGFGTRGPVALVEAGPQSGWWVKQQAQAEVRPVTSSFVSVLRSWQREQTTAPEPASPLRTLGQSDLRLSNAQRVPGYTLAALDGAAVHGTPLDTVEQLSPATLQHQGETILRLTRQFGKQPLLDETRAPDRVFFSAFGQVLHYPLEFVLPLTVAVDIGLCAVLVWGILRQRLSVRGLVQGALAAGAQAVLAACAGLVLWTAVDWLWAERMVTPSGVVQDGALYAGGLVLFTFALSFVLVSRTLAHVRRADVLGGAMLLFLVLKDISAVFAPGLSFLFTWPLVAAAGVLACCLCRPQTEDALTHPLATVGLLLPTLSLLAPVLYMGYGLLTIGQFLWLMPLLALSLALCSPAVAAMRAAGPTYLPTCAALTAFLLLVISGVSAHPGMDRPTPSNLFYVYDATQQQARWVSDRASDEHSATLLTNPSAAPASDWLAVSDRAPLLTTSTAPLSNLLQPPLLTIASDQTQAGLRTVHVHIQPQRRAFDLLLAATGAGFTDIELLHPSGGKRVLADAEQIAKQWSLHVSGLPAAGTDLRLTFPAEERPRLRVTAVSPELPGLPGVSYQPRPPWLMAGGLYDHMTLITRELAIE